MKERKKREKSSSLDNKSENKYRILFDPLTAEYTDFKRLDSFYLEKASEEDYRETAKRIVYTSMDQLKEQNQSKKGLKERFANLFSNLILLQSLCILIILILKGFVKRFVLSDTVFITLISSVFVETLGVIILMVKYAFNSDQEVQILQILNNFLRNFQKYHNTSNENDSSDEE